MSANRPTTVSSNAVEQPLPGYDEVVPRAARLTVDRHSEESWMAITLAGEIDLDSAPLVREALGRCLGDGRRTIEVDLAQVTFCDCSGLNAFLHAFHRATAAGGRLRLHHPRPIVARLLVLTRTDTVLLRGQGSIAIPAPARPVDGGAG